MVIDNNDVYAREVEAENWLRILTTLYQARDLITDQAEIRLLNKLALHGSLLLGDVVDPGDREASFTAELALLRLLHCGKVSADLMCECLNFDTEIRLCA